MNITFEIAGEEDALALIEVRNKSFYDDFIRFGECPGYNISITEMKQLITKLFTYKIIADGKIIGNIQCFIRKANYYWLHNLAIIPEYQNKGIGAKAIAYIEKTYPDATTWGLDTPAQNSRNCYFYEKAGFIKKAEKKYSEKLTLRIYEKTIK
ncbi:MAG: hypothetical protein H6Q74_2255 [Firmicutes bacterium]|nr:hypothetical protein [Bacillota bacterium]